MPMSVCGIEPEAPGRVVSTPATHSRTPEFTFWNADPVSQLVFDRGFHHFSRQIPGHYFGSGHDRFLPFPY